MIGTDLVYVLCLSINQHMCFCGLVCISYLRGSTFFSKSKRRLKSLFSSVFCSVADYKTMVKYHNPVDNEIRISLDGSKTKSDSTLERAKTTPWKRKLIITLYIVSLSSLVYSCYVYELYLFQLQEGYSQNYTSLPGPIPNLINHLENTFDYELPVEASATEAIRNVLDQLACNLPVLDPFDSSLAKFMISPKPLNCRVPELKFNRPWWTKNATLEKYELLFEVDLHSNLIMLEDVKKHGFEGCCYKNFSRINDYEVTELEWCSVIEYAETKIPAEHEFIEIYCLRKSMNSADNQNKSSRKHYKVVDVFNLVPLKPEVEQRIQEIEETQTSSGRSQKNLNVVILGLDGVAHMNLIRRMPKTYNYLTNEMSAIGMNGYTKVGDNTFPNMVAALMGKSMPELKSSCWKNGNASLPFDDCPFIWKNFSSAGYRTSFAEDAQWMAIFHYLKYGFQQQPTDYYLRTLNLHMEERIGHSKRRNAKLCYGPRPAFFTLLDNIRKMATTMGNDKKYFQFTWATSLFHDDLNNALLGDVPVRDTLKWIKEEGHLENSLMILMSDHGSAYGPILETYQGKVESRMPFLYFTFPKWFSEKYQSAVSNFKVNRNRLTTPFDLHETLLDLLNLESIEDSAIRERHVDLRKSLNSGSLPRGISLFIPIPLSRDCEVAGITEHFCVCHKMVSVSLEEKWIQKAAGFVVDELNKLITEFPQCSLLELQEVKSVEQLMPSQNKTMTSSAVNKYTVTFSTVPGNATFEATLKSKGARNKEWTIAGEISRLNLYGTQSRCVTDYNMKKYCYCP